MLVDLLGPPPKSVMAWEHKYFRDLVEPKWREEEERREARQAAADAAEAAIEAAAAAIEDIAAAALAAEAAAKQAILDVGSIGIVSHVSVIIQVELM